MTPSIRGDLVLVGAFACPLFCHQAAPCGRLSARRPRVAAVLPPRAPAPFEPSSVCGSVLEPPCIRHRRFAIAGAWQRVCGASVPTPWRHRRGAGEFPCRNQPWVVVLLCMGVIDDNPPPSRGIIQNIQRLISALSRSIRYGSCGRATGPPKHGHGWCRPALSCASTTTAHSCGANSCATAATWATWPAARPTGWRADGTNYDLIYPSRLLRTGAPTQDE